MDEMGALKPGDAVSGEHLAGMIRDYGAGLEENHFVQCSSALLERTKEQECTWTQEGIQQAINMGVMDEMGALKPGDAVSGEHLAGMIRDYGAGLEENHFVQCSSALLERA